MRTTKLTARMTIAMTDSLQQSIESRAAKMGISTVEFCRAALAIAAGEGIHLGKPRRARLRYPELEGIDFEILAEVLGNRENSPILADSEFNT